MRQSMEEEKNKALDEAKAKIVELTSLVSVVEEKAKCAKEAVRSQGTHDDEAGPSSTTQAPSSPQPLPSQGSTYYQEWEKTLLDSITIHLI